MKCFLPLIVFAFTLSFNGLSQFSDDFSDGNLDGWQGNTDHFIVNASGHLQLNAPAGSTTSWIYTSVSFEDSMSWDMYLKLAFAPSTSNQLRIYLGLTSPDLATASGYFLEIGASGDLDALEFKYLNAGVFESIASSAQGLVAADPVELRIRVVRNNDGLWQFYNISGVIPELLFSATHDLLSLSSLTTFGFFGRYTDTRRDKFFFDDIMIQAPQSDSEPPRWLALSIIDDHTLSLLFDEVLDPASAANPLNYVLTPGGIHPEAINVSSNVLILSFAQAFQNQLAYTLTISNISDPSGNILTSASRNFTYSQIKQAGENELLITEIMPDPTPVIGLPNAEYLEIFNNSDMTFHLADYILKIGTSERPLPDSLLLPGEYVIVTDDSNASLFSAIGRVVVLESFPALTNSGTTVALVNTSGEQIHGIAYDLSWYHDAAKSDGGWSIEMINPNHVCAAKENWAASVNISGGTPGRQNSQWDLSEDVSGPELISIYTGTPGIIELRFNEKPDDLLMLDIDHYRFNPVIAIDHVELNQTVVTLFLVAPLEESVTYRLLSFEAFDCLGNARNTNDTILFGLVSAAVRGDLLINEILFNPRSGGSRFIEIINVSEKFIDLSTLSIGKITSTQTDLKPVTVQEIIKPGEIIVFSPDPSDIISRYNVPHPEKLFESLLPSWGDKRDQVSIVSFGMVIDSFTYSSDWHHPVISDQNGVSLERIAISAPAWNRSIWHSATSISGFATPTAVNSQSLSPIPSKPPFTLSSKHFSPDGDGFKDFLLIHFEPEAGNAVGSIWVYDLEGREIFQVLSNEIVGTSAILQWDGRNAEGVVSDMGIYLIFVQLWDAEGNVRQYQESCALVKR